MNDAGSILEEALRIALQDAHRLEVVGREIANVDTSRIRTDIKIVEHSIEHGNYENAARVLKSMIERLIALLKDAFEQYKAEVLELTIAVSELLDTSEDKAEVEALKKGIDACMSPSEIAKLREYGDALMRKSMPRWRRCITRFLSWRRK
jgi:ribosomal protein S20